MKGLSILLRKDVIEQWRTYHMPVVAIIFLVFGMGSPILAKYTPELLAHSGGNVQIIVPTPTTVDAVESFLSNAGSVSAFAAILLAMSTVARERERGTAALVLSKPVSRTAFLVSKFSALLVVLAVGIIIGGLADYAYTAALFSTMSVPGFVACCALLLLETMVFAVVTFFASTLIGSSLPAAGVGLGTYILTAIVSIDQIAGHAMPGGLESPARALALGQPVPHLWTSLGFNLFWIAIFLVASWLVFRNQEFGS